MATPGRIFVCITCDRHAPFASDAARRGGQLAVALRAAALGAEIVVRSVECLNGCPRPCTAALRAPGKAVIRFAGLTPADAPALIAAAACFAESLDGDIHIEALHETLREKLSTKTNHQLAAKE